MHAHALKNTNTANPGQFLSAKMTKQLAMLGIVSVLAIAGIFVLVDGLLKDISVTGQPWVLRTESGVEVLQGEMPTISVCRNTVYCLGQATYTCCKHDGSSCVIPTPEEQSIGSCPKTHRSRCVCGEAYEAYLEEK